MDDSSANLDVQYHRQSLSCRCRVCGNLLKDCGTEATTEKETLKEALEIDISSDHEDIHPPRVCSSCRLKLKAWKTKKSKHKKVTTININEAEWNPHDIPCSVCDQSSLPRPHPPSPVDAAKATASHVGVLSWCEGDRTVFVKHSACGMSVERHLLINADNSWVVRIHNEDVSNHLYLAGIPRCLSTDRDGMRLVNDVFCSGLCTGNIGFDDVAAGKRVLTGHRDEVVGKIRDISTPSQTKCAIFHARCRIFMGNPDTSVCGTCFSFRTDLSSRRSSQRTPRNVNTETSSRVRIDYMNKEQMQEKNANLQRKIKRLQTQTDVLKQMIKERHEMDSVVMDQESSDNLQELLQSEHVNICKYVTDNSSEEESAAFKLMMQEQMSAFAAKDSKQIRWHPAIIRFAVGLYSKSSSAYNLIRSSGFLKLPHQTTLKKFMNFTTPQVGINPAVLKYIFDDWHLKDIPDFEKNITLAFDEIKLKAGLVYSKVTGKIIGYTDLGPISNEMDNFNHRLTNQEDGEVATQMLVLMIRGIFSDMRVPLAYFPTTTASSHQLYFCIWPTVKALALMGLKVRAFVCDGASWNKKFYGHHVLRKEPGTTTYYTPHPFFRGERLYFICDVPHLVKTTRNNWENSNWHLKSRKLRYNNQDIAWTQLVRLWEWDRKEAESPGLRKLHKISDAHIRLSPSLRMRVSLAANVLSSTVANCFKSYREHTGTTDTQSTELFCRMFDKFFDCLNVRTVNGGTRHQKETIKEYRDATDPRFTWLLQEFLPWLEGWEREALSSPGLSRSECRKRCLSEQTLEGIRITVLSFVELAQELLQLPGVKYLLSDKFNQDPLEEWFGSVRGAGGSNNNPTAQSLGYIHLNLLVAGSNAVSSTRRNVRSQKRKQNLSDTPLPCKKPKRKTLF